MKFRKIPTISIILVLFAFAFAVWAEYQFSVYRQGDDFARLSVVSDYSHQESNEPIAIKGRIVTDKKPKDTMTGVFADCLILERTVEMYQYVVDNDEVYMQYSSNCEGNITGKNGEKYSNPVFPEDLENAVFFGNAALEGTELTVGPRILSNFTGQPGHNLIGTLVSFENEYGLKPNGNGGYDNCKAEKPQIGDIRITYVAHIPSDYDEALIIGKITDGVIGAETDEGICLIDFETESPEEIYNSLFYSHRNDAVGLLIFSLILLTLSVVICICKNHKMPFPKKAAFCLMLPIIIAALSVTGSADFGDFGGNNDYGGGESYGGNSYGSHDYGSYDYNSGNNYNYKTYDYDRTTAAPATTAYYSVGAVRERTTHKYNADGKEIDPAPLEEPSPDYEKGQNAVFLTFFAVIIASFVLSAVRKDKTSVKKTYIPGAQLTDRSQLINIDKYNRIDPDFSQEDFKNKLSDLYVKLQNCWQGKNLEDLRPFLSDAFYAQSNNQLERYKVNGQTNYIDMIQVLSVDITGWKQESGRDIIIAVIRTKIIDYVVDDNQGTIVSGSKTAEKIMTYEWTLERTSGVKTHDSDTLTLQVCPNCGAQVSINHSAECEYCGTILTTDRFDWVLTSIKGISQRTIEK